MTREQAFRLAKKHWGSEGGACRATECELWKGKLRVAKGKTWEEACRRAGLLTTNEEER